MTQPGDSATRHYRTTIRVIFCATSAEEAKSFAEDYTEMVSDIAGSCHHGVVSMTTPVECPDHAAAEE
jgi:hypothetical protein